MFARVRPPAESGGHAMPPEGEAHRYGEGKRYAGHSEAGVAIADRPGEEVFGFPRRVFGGHASQEETLQELQGLAKALVAAGPLAQEERGELHELQRQQVPAVELSGRAEVAAQRNAARVKFQSGEALVAAACQALAGSLVELPRAVVCVCAARLVRRALFGGSPARRGRDRRFRRRLRRALDRSRPAAPRPLSQTRGFGDG